MSEENAFERCEENDPNRCKGIDATGQCRYKAVPNAIYCPRHGGHLGQAQVKQKQMRMYRLRAWNDRLEQLLESEHVKTVREELSILRLMLEEIINKCKSADDLILWSDKITNTISIIERLVMSCQKLEEKSGTLLDQNSILTLADTLCTILTDYVKDPDQLTEIGRKFVEQVAANVRGKAECIA